MKKVFYAFVALVTMAIAVVSCNNWEDEGNRALTTIGVIVKNTLYDDSGLEIRLKENKYPNGTRGYFAVYYKSSDVKTSTTGQTYIDNAEAVLYSRFLVRNMESLTEAEAKGVDVTKLTGFENVGCVVGGGFLQVYGYDRYQNDSLYHMVYDVASQKSDTLKLILCNTGEAKDARRQMHVDFDLSKAEGIRTWKDSIVVSVIPANGKAMNVKIGRQDFLKKYVSAY